MQEKKRLNRAIVWFRTDLRVADNEAFYKAAEKYDEIIPLYIFDRERLLAQQYGAQKCGAYRILFILESLCNLKSELRNLGGDLLVLFGKPKDVIGKLSLEYQIDSILCHKEVAPEEIQDELEMEQALHGKTELKFFWGHSLFHINDLPFEYTALPKVFTDFRKAVEKKSSVRSLFPKPEQINLPKGLQVPGLPTLADFGYEEKTPDKRAAIRFKGGEVAALERLNSYFFQTKALGHYKETRNEMIGPDYSSKFSAWLSQGCISPRTIYSAVKEYESLYGSNSSTYWLIFELLWRDFFRFTALKSGSALFAPAGIKGAVKPATPNLEILNLWKRGATGIPFIDANMKELNHTGFMSNRGRQNVASYLVHDLRQDWRYGAAYFEEKLIDYDVASNWANWAYVAGVGNDPRGNRYFNVLSQAEKYDADADYVKTWLPVLKDLPNFLAHQPWKATEMEKGLYGMSDIKFPSPLALPRGA